MKKALSILLAVTLMLMTALPAIPVCALAEDTDAQLNASQDSGSDTNQGESGDTPDPDPAQGSTDGGTEPDPGSQDDPAAETGGDASEGQGTGSDGTGTGGDAETGTGGDAGSGTGEGTGEGSGEGTGEGQGEGSGEGTGEGSGEGTGEGGQPDGVDAEPVDWEAVRASEAWYAVSEESVVYGKLDDVIHTALEEYEPLNEDQPLVVNICRDEVLLIKSIRRGDIKFFDFKIDLEALPDCEEMIVSVSENDPDSSDAVDPQDDVEPDPDELTDFYIYLEPKVEPTPEPTPEPSPERELTVQSDLYTPDVWMKEAVTFTLSGLTEDDKYWEYGVVRYGAKGLELVEDGLFTAEDEGEYTLRFVMLDDMGDVVAASDLYTMRIDRTPPVINYIETDGENDYQMTILAEDGLSGLDAFSIDGGETWIEPDDNGDMIYVAQEKTELEAGSVAVRDKAGHITYWPEAVTLKRSSWGGGGGGGGDGGSGSGGRSNPHSSGDNTERSRRTYDTVDVSPEDTDGTTFMHTLILDGEQLDLTLELEEADHITNVDAVEPVFALQLLYWEQPASDDGEDRGPSAPADPDPAEEQAEPSPNTLALVLRDDPHITDLDHYAYRWHINGAVLRQLKKSGITYLALVAGDYVVALPSDGFLAGEAYVEMKMQGVSTRRFDYDVVMRYDAAARDTSDAPDAVTSPWTNEIRVTVNDETTVLTGDEDTPLYLTDVCVGPKAIFDHPYGTWSEERAAEAPAR